MASFKVVIQAIPQRKEMAEELARATGGEIIMAQEGESCDLTHIRTLQAAGDVDYLIRLEDDVQIAPDFFEVIPEALETMKEQGFSVMVLYTNYPVVVETMPEQGHLVIPMLRTSHISGVGLIYDTKILPGFLEWYPTMPWQYHNEFHIYGPPDGAIAFYCRTHDLTLSAITPCIVQHRNTDTFLFGDLTRDRQSLTYRKRYGTEVKEASDADTGKEVKGHSDKPRRHSRVS